MTTTETPTTTVMDRLLEAGITESRAREHLADGWVSLDGVVVTDPAASAARPVRVDLRPRFTDEP